MTSVFAPETIEEAQDWLRERLAAKQPTWRNPTERKGKLIWYSQAIGNEPHLPDVVLERVREMASKC